MYVERNKRYRSIALTTSYPLFCWSIVLVYTVQMISQPSTQTTPYTPSYAITRIPSHRQYSLYDTHYATPRSSTNWRRRSQMVNKRKRKGMTPNITIWCTRYSSKQWEKSTAVKSRRFHRFHHLSLPPTPALGPPFSLRAKPLPLSQRCVPRRSRRP